MITKDIHINATHHSGLICFLIWIKFSTIVKKFYAGNKSGWMRKTNMGAKKYWTVLNWVHTTITLLTLHGNTVQVTWHCNAPWLVMKCNLGSNTMELRYHSYATKWHCAIQQWHSNLSVQLGGTVPYNSGTAIHKLHCNLSWPCRHNALQAKRYWRTVM